MGKYSTREFEKLIFVGVKSADKATLPRIEGRHVQVALILGDDPVVPFRVQSAIGFPN